MALHSPASHDTTSSIGSAPSHNRGHPPRRTQGASSLCCTTSLIGLNKFLALLAVVVFAMTAAMATTPICARRIPSDAEIEALEKVLGYVFHNKWNIKVALIHVSFGELNNARLTWLGDSVMGAAVSDLIYRAFPDATTADLHNHRAVLVPRKACAEHARKLGLEKLMVVGKGYEGQEPSMAMLAECFEAVWGAIYEDAGFQLEAVKQTYAALFPIPPLPPEPLAGSAELANGTHAAPSMVVVPDYYPATA